MLDIVVYGNGDVFREYFNAIVTSFGASDFNTLIKLAILLAGTTVIFSFIIQRDLLVIVKWFGLYYIVVFVLFTPKTTVEIIDRVNQGHVYTVDNVPLGLAVVASYTSAIGDALTQLTEMNFTMPDDLRYGKTGLVFASRLVTEASQFEITDPEFDQNLQSFIQQCVFYDVLLHKYTITDLINANKLWDFVSANTSPARAFIYNREVTTCKTGASFLNTDWKEALDHAAGQYSNRLFPNESNTKEKLFRSLEKGYGYLTKLSDQGSEIMKQHLMANAIQRGVIRMDGSVNAAAAMESFAYTRAQDQKRLTNKTLGDMAAYWLPLMKNAFEAIMYGCFIFIVLLSVFPFGWVVLKHYIFTLLWIQLWAPLYAIINLLVSYYSSIQSAAAVAGNLTLKSMPGLLQINSDMAGLAGYLTLSVPFLSAGLAKGMAGTFTQLSQYVNGVTQSTGGAAAQEAVTGNMSLGNTNFQNHSYFNTNANHYDTSGRFSAGQFTGMLPGGSTVTAMPDGNLVMNTQGAISNLGTNVNLSQSIRETASHQGEIASTYAKQQASALSTATSSSYREAAELSQHFGHSKGSGSNWSISTNASTATALNNIERLTERFAKDHNMSYGDASRVLGSVAGNMHAGLGGQTPGGVLSAGISLSGRREADHSTSSDERTLYNEAKDYIKDSNYSKNMDVIERAVQEKSLKINDDEGSRLLNNMQSSIDKAKTARDEMTESLQTAQSYRQIAQSASENASTINSNLSQVFKDWLVNQPGTNGKGHMGHAMTENILIHDPIGAQHYAESFSREYTADLLKENKNKMIPASIDSVKHHYDGKHNLKQNEAKITADFNQHRKDVLHKAEQKHLNHDFSIDESSKRAAEGKIQTNQKIIQEAHQHIQSEGQKRIDQVDHENKYHSQRESGLFKEVLLAKNIDTSDKDKP